MNRLLDSWLSFSFPERQGPFWHFTERFWRLLSTRALRVLQRSFIKTLIKLYNLRKIIKWHWQRATATFVWMTRDFVAKSVPFCIDWFFPLTPTILLPDMTMTNPLPYPSFLVGSVFHIFLDLVLCFCLFSFCLVPNVDLVFGLSILDGLFGFL